MISNQILQNTIEGLKGISRVDFCVLDTEGKELAATFDMAKDCGEAVLSFVESPADSQVIQGCQFFKIFDEQRLEYVLLADGETEDVYMLGKIAAFQIQSLLVAYKERFDKDNFIKNLLLDNLLLVDIYNRAKKLHIDTEVKRVIFIIETSHEKDSAALDNVRNLLGGKSRDFITAVDEKNIIVVKELSDKDGNKELEKMAKEMLDTLRRARQPQTGPELAQALGVSLRTLYRDIHDDACWLVTLVENLLSITRIDNGTLHIARQPELVGEVVREALQHVDRRAGQRRIDRAE